MVRLGTPTIMLNKQGRARPAICNLYRWRYEELGDLAHPIERDVAQARHTHATPCHTHATPRHAPKPRLALWASPRGYEDHQFYLRCAEAWLK